LNSQVVGDPVGYEPGSRFVDVADGEHHQEPAEACLLEPEEAAHLRIVDVDHAEVPAAQRLRTVGSEVDRHTARQQPVADHLDAEALANQASVPVAGDHVASPDLILGAVDNVAHRRSHARVVLLVADELGRVLEAGPELAARCSRSGSSTCWGMNRRRAGLTSSIPPLMLGM
jgi:hypothetical protein